jgi:hypothetical protein
MTPYSEFWEAVTGSPDGPGLLLTVRESAVALLREKELVQTLKEHFARTRIPKPKRYR